MRRARRAQRRPIVRLDAWLERRGGARRPMRVAARLAMTIAAGLVAAGAARGDEVVETQARLPVVVDALAGAAQPSARARCGPETPPSVHCGVTPTAAFDRSGRLWVAFAQGGHVYVASSDDAGRSFRPAVRVNAVAEALDVNGENRPKIAFGTRGEIYISWTRKLPGGYNGDIRFSRSLDGGERFEPPRTVNDDGLPTGHRFESLEVDAAGNVYLVWLDKRDASTGSAEAGAGGASVYYTVSTDGGATFAPNRRVEAGSCECCRIAIASPPSTHTVGAAIFWRHVFSDGVRDHAFAVIGPGGVVAPAHRATYDGWRIDACPHHGPAMSAVGDGSYDLAWFSGGGVRKGIVYGRYAPGVGLTRVRTMSASPGASHPHLAAVGGRTLLVWKEFDGESTRVLLTVTDDGGLEWSAPATVASTLGASDHPFLATRGEEAFLVWHTDDAGLVVVRLRGTASASPLPSARPAAQIPFDVGDLAEIERRHGGEAFVVVLWSLDCAPCRRELALLGDFRRRHPELELVLISTDPPEAAAAASEVLSGYGLADAEAHGFASRNAERLRHAIDPEWFGELPRAYFYAADGTRSGVSGALSEELLREWLETAGVR